MSYIVELSLFSLLIFNHDRLVRAFNETCGGDKPACSEPLTCINGFCLCSKFGKTIDSNNPLSFWTGDQCMSCPTGYTTAGVKCYKIISGKANQMNWERARETCKDSGGDLFVLRSYEEFNLIAPNIKAHFQNNEMFQRSPKDASYFGSLWIGARLLDWNGDGRFQLVSHGEPLTKRSRYWCTYSSPLGEEPNLVGLKETGERQACVGLAFFSNGLVCMHDWFCSWETHTLCEIHPPATPSETGPEALEEDTPNNTLLMLGIGGGILLLLLASVGVFCFMCNTKKGVRRGRSFESMESGMSLNSF